MNEKKTILIVDDDADVVSTVELILESEGYRVISASNGDEGLAVARKERPDLMILDVMMTYQVEGIDVSKKIVEIPELKDMPVIMMTSIGRVMNLPFKLEPDEAYLPVNRLIEKPVNAKKLISEIESLLK